MICVGEIKKEEYLPEQFRDEDQCRAHLFNLRFPNGGKCPRCENTKLYATSDGTYKCSKCKYKMSVRTGTPFEGSSLKLRQWFAAIKYASSVECPGKIKLLEYQTVAEAGSNNSAKRIQTVILKALNRPCLIKLTGNVGIMKASYKVNGSFIMLGVAIEVHNKKLLRIRAKIMEDNTDAWISFVTECVDKDAVVCYAGDIDNAPRVRLTGRKELQDEFRCKSAEAFIDRFVVVLRTCENESQYQESIDAFCSEVNSLYTPISFDELLERIISLPPKPKK